MTKISDLTDGSTADATDRLAVARSPFATGDDRYITPLQLLTYIAANIGIDVSQLDDASANGRSLISAADYAAMKALLNLEIGTDVLAEQTIGIADDNLMEVDGSPNSAEYARFTANGLEGRTEAEFKADFNLEANTDFYAPGGTDVAVADGGTGSSTAAAAKVALENERLVQNSQSGAYPLVLGDAGKHILHPSADTTARIFTIPANGAVAFAVGTCVTFINQDSAGAVTIAITTDTMRLAGAGTTGSRTLAANGVATAIKVTSTEWIISGVGLT